MYNKQKHDLFYVARFHLKHIIAVEHKYQQKKLFFAMNSSMVIHWKTTLDFI